jgi:hypothetical protein
MFVLLPGNVDAGNCVDVLSQRRLGSGLSVDVWDGRAYLGTEGSLIIADLTNLSHPRTIGSLEVSDWVRAVAARDGFAFVAASSTGLIVVDVSNPVQPIQIGALAIPGGAWDIALAADHALLADLAAGIRAIDISLPSAPVEVGFLPVANGTYGIAIDGTLALIAGDHDFLVVDISQPAAPAVTGGIYGFANYQSVVASDGLAYVGDALEGLEDCGSLMSQTPRHRRRWRRSKATKLLRMS